MYANIDERVYLSVFYIDMLQRKHKEFYNVNFIGGAERLQDDEGTILFKEWKSLNLHEISSLKVDDILNDVAKKF